MEDTAYGREISIPIASLSESAHVGRMPVTYVFEGCLTVSVNYLNLDTP